MDNKITIQELSESISKRQNILKKDADLFVRLFFETIEENLLQDKIVKVKGLGTFKLIEVADRESVDVNTGSRIKISGHTKVTFTPDGTLRDQINKPFAAFETIILNDGTDVDEMEKLPEQSEDVSDIAEETEQSEVEDESEDIIETDNQPQDRISEVLQDATESLYDRLPENEESESLPEVEETIAEIANEQEELPAPVVPDSPVEEATPSDIQPVSVEQVNSEEATESTIPDDSNNEMQQVQSPAPTRTSIWLYVCLSLLVLMLMIVSYFAGYYRLLCPCVGCGEAAPKVETVEDEDTLTTTPVVESEVIEENPADNFEQVPGGQYLIVGTKGTHVMKAGDSLLKIAIREYGHKDYVKYIVVHNGFRNPDVIPLGYEVKLPELK